MATQSGPGMNPLVAGFVIDREDSKSSITADKKVMKAIASDILTNATYKPFKENKDDGSLDTLHYPETVEQCNQYLAKTMTEFKNGNYDSLIFFVSSHGAFSKDGKMFIKLKDPLKFNVEDIVKKFDADIELRDKLKLFVIQACRNEEGTKGANQEPDYFVTINIVSDAVLGQQEPHTSDSGLGSSTGTGSIEQNAKGIHTVIII